MLLSMIAPLLGNLCLAFYVDHARQLLTSSTALGRTNITAGCLMLGVSAVIIII